MQSTWTFRVREKRVVRRPQFENCYSFIADRKLVKKNANSSIALIKLVQLEKNCNRVLHLRMSVMFLMALIRVIQVATSEAFETMLVSPWGGRCTVYTLKRLTQRINPVWRIYAVVMRLAFE